MDGASNRGRGRSLAVRIGLVTLVSTFILVGLAAVRSGAREPGIELPVAVEDRPAREALERALTDLLRHDTQALLVARGERLVLERYVRHRWSEFGTPGETRRLWTASMSKAVVGGLLVAAAACDGLIDLDTPAADYLPEWAARPQLRSVTVRDLANHLSGLANAGDTKLESDRAGIDEAWERDYWDEIDHRVSIAMHDVPVLYPPGTRFHYSNPAYSALALLLARRLPEERYADLEAYYRERIAAPLGIPAGQWTLGYGRRTVTHGATVTEIGGGSTFTGRALVRIGQVLLHEETRAALGSCIPAAISPPKEARHGPSPVHLGWWSNAQGLMPALPTDTLIAAGSEHRVVVVIPSLDLVVVRVGSKPLGRNNFGGDYWEALERRLMLPILDALGRAEEASGQI